MKLKKITTENLKNFYFKINKKKINENDDVFKKLDSMEIMIFLSEIEKNFKVKLDMIKILNQKKLYLKNISFLIK